MEHVCQTPKPGNPGYRALTGRNTSTRLTRGLCVGHPVPSVLGGIKGVSCVPVQHAFAVEATHLAFHKARKRLAHWKPARRLANMSPYQAL